MARHDDEIDYLDMVATIIAQMIENYELLQNANEEQEDLENE